MRTCFAAFFSASLTQCSTWSFQVAYLEGGFLTYPFSPKRTPTGKPTLFWGRVPLRHLLFEAKQAVPSLLKATFGYAEGSHRLHTGTAPCLTWFVLGLFWVCFGFDRFTNWKSRMLFAFESCQAGMQNSCTLMLRVCVSISHRNTLDHG